MQPNSKAVEAKERKAEAKGAAASKSKQQEEDSYWDAAANPRTKRDSKKEDEERRKTEAAAKRAEVKRLQQEEEAALAAAAKKKPAAPKITSHQLHLQAEADRKQRERDAAARAADGKRVVSEEEYAQSVAVDNTNRDDVAVEARSLDAALEQLSVAQEGTPTDRHPEKCACRCVLGVLLVHPPLL